LLDGPRGLNGVKRVALLCTELCGAVHAPLWLQRTGSAFRSGESFQAQAFCVDGGFFAA
jgi:hypothetical protein